RALLYFFFQAEDGIRDDLVTGVQTCALPISSVGAGSIVAADAPSDTSASAATMLPAPTLEALRTSPPSSTRTPSPSTHACTTTRSEERRVGKERGSRQARSQAKQKQDDAACR